MEHKYSFTRESWHEMIFPKKYTLIDGMEIMELRPHGKGYPIVGGSKIINKIPCAFNQLNNLCNSFLYH